MALKVKAVEKLVKFNKNGALPFCVYGKLRFVD